jgi:DNA topoisomerase VI subunit B
LPPKSEQGHARRAPLVRASNFLLATRDSGYRSTAYAVAEFVDNSLQAGASSVSVHVLTVEDPSFPIELMVVDDGAGMAEETFADSLSFGGSTRFNDRSSLGRYGRGLPNGALSCGRCVEVYSWRRGRVLTTRLDVDELLVAG